MLRLDHVPLEVKRAMRAAWSRRNNSDSPEKHMADLAVAAINAWPGVVKNYSWDASHGRIILPIKENTNDKT